MALDGVYVSILNDDALAELGTFMLVPFDDLKKTAQAQDKAVSKAGELNLCLLANV